MVYVVDQHVSSRFSYEIYSIEFHPILCCVWSLGLVYVDFGIYSLGLFYLSAGSCCVRHLFPDARVFFVSQAMLLRWLGG